MVETLPDIAWKQASVGGKIYILPNVNFEYNERAELIRGDLREKYGLDKVKSLDDLEKYLKTIAENEKSMEASGGNIYFQNVWLIEPNGWKGNSWSYKSEETTNPMYFHIAFTDEFMDYAKKMRSFYESGIFSPSLINDSTTMQDKFANGISSLDVENTRTINSRAVDINKKHPEWKVEMVYTNHGKKVVPGNFVGNGFVVTHTSEYATKIMEVVNRIYESAELQKLLNWGFEGVNYEMKGDKIYPISDVPADKKFDIGCNWNFYNSVFQDAFAVKEMHEGYAEIKEDLAKNSVSNPLAAFSFDKEEVVTEVTNMSEVEKSYNALNFGMYEDVEGTVAEYRQALKAAGYDKVKAEYDRQVKEFMATYNN